jgi:hypothetical protein
MAKIKLKYGENEIEIESRDYYVDNQSIGEVIETITNHLEGKIRDKLPSQHQLS